MKINNNFYIKCYLIILAIDSANANQYILLNKDKTIPNFDINNNNVIDLDSTVSTLANNLVFSDPIELIPQLITFNSSNIINGEEKELNLVYGFIIDYHDKIHDDTIWQQFSYDQPNEYTNIIFEVSQKLR
jgi:hypothetical protein